MTIRGSLIDLEKLYFQSSGSLLESKLTFFLTGGAQGQSGGSGVGTVSSVAGKTGDVILAEGDVTGLTADLAAKANSANPVLSGTVTVPTPSSATDAANKGYVDAVATGLSVKASVRAISTTNITLSGTQTVDGVALIAGDRILVAGQTTGANNGIYVVAAGAWARSTDADISAEVLPGMFTFVTEGTVNAGIGYVLVTVAPITLGSTALVFSQFSGTGQITAGSGLTKIGNALSVPNAGITAAMLAGSIPASDLVGNDITTVGTVTTGTWAAGTIPVNKGGTGAVTLTGVLKGNGTGALTAATAGTDFLAPTGNGSSLTGITESQVANLTTDLNAKAPAANPTLTGNVVVPTQAPGDNSTKAANTAFVTAGLAALLVSPTLTGTVTVPDQLLSDNSGKAANTKYVNAANAIQVPLPNAATQAFRIIGYGVQGTLPGSATVGDAYFLQA